MTLILRRLALDLACAIERGVWAFALGLLEAAQSVWELRFELTTDVRELRSDDK